MTYDREALKNRVETIFYDMISVPSFTGNVDENAMVPFFKKYFEGIPYFQKNPSHCGFYPIPNDPPGRSVPFALLKGEGDDTVVLVHHTDIINTDDYGDLKPIALSPEPLMEALRAGKMELDPVAQKELESGEWIFGRGTADMKGGGSVQLALLEEYAKRDNFKGNLLLIGVPDEESLSAGMRAAIGLLKEMKEKHGLNYILLLDSEPDKRMNGKPTITDGSVGKILPLFYVRGVQAHVGQIFYGINPLHILSEIISRTDSSADFCESSGNTITPPPSWLYGKDTKTVYDVTYPAAACGYMNLFMLEKTPEEHMKGLYDICLSAMTDVLKRRNENYACYLELQGRPRAELPYKPLVKTFREVYDEAKKDSGSAFEDAYKAAENSARKEISENRMTMFEASKLLIETALRYRHDLSPVVVLGLMPPYYPAVNNVMIPERMAPVDRATRKIMDFAKEEYDLEYEIINHNVGICDLSYGMFTAPLSSIDYIENNMLLWGDAYYIPLADIRDLSMPVLNIGPYGKAGHQHAERVWKEDLFYRTPKMMDLFLSDLLGN